MLLANCITRFPRLPYYHPPPASSQPRLTNHLSPPITQENVVLTWYNSCLSFILPHTTSLPLTATCSSFRGNYFHSSRDSSYNPTVKSLCQPPQRANRIKSSTTTFYSTQLRSCPLLPIKPGPLSDNIACMRNPALSRNSDSAFDRNVDDENLRH